MNIRLNHGGPWAVALVVALVGCVGAPAARADWEVVGTAGFSPGAADYTSLAFYNGEPYVAYADGANGSKATVMRYTGKSWETVGKAGFSAGEADYTSLAFYDGEPHVAYMDAENKNTATVMHYTGGSWQTVGTAGFSAGSATYTVLAFDGGEPHVAYMDGANGNKATVMRYPAPPTMQATLVMFSNVGAGGATIAWTRGNGSACAVFMAQADSGSAAPADNSTYAAGAAFGSGTQIGTTGWYCLYNGSGTGVSVTGLSPGTTYRVMVCEYTGSAGNEDYLTGSATGNPAGVLTVPAAPTATSATNPTASGFAANWNATTGATGYRLDVAADSGFAAFVTGYQDLDAGNVTTYAVSGLNAGTTYHYRLRAYDASGTSANSNTIDVLTVPGVLTATSATNTTASGFAANWNATTGATDYRLDVATDSGFTAFVTGYENLDAGNVTTYAVSGLDAGTQYHYRVRAYNGSGTSANSSTISVTLLALLPTVTTAVVSNVTTTTADCGGHVPADGGTTVTARGVYWNTAGTPTTAEAHTSDGAGTGAFTSRLTGLSPGTTYYVRAYATNNVGTNYGSERSFTTGATPPTVTTAAVSDVTTGNATCGGDVTASGGATVTARGVCCNTAGTPTTADAHTSDGTGTGAFTSRLTGLSPGTTYYVRAYATNDAGMAYGRQVSFSTAVAPPSESGASQPDLRISVTPQITEARVGDELAFQATVANIGNAVATNVVLTFPLPPNTEFVSARLGAGPAGQSAPPDARVEDGRIIIALGHIALDEQLAINLVLRALAASKVTLTASALCEESGAPVTAQANPDVDVTDVYWEIVNTVTPVKACGWLGVTPLFTLFGLAELKRRAAWNERPPATRSRPCGRQPRARDGR